MGMMETKFEEMSINLEKIGHLSPSQMEAWDSFMNMTEKEGALSLRRKELIAIALSVIAKCDWCIALHVKKALQQGARKQEIVEAAWVSVLMGGGPALMYAQRVLQALEEFQEIQEETLYIGAGLKNEEIDSEFSKLYQQLVNYVKQLCTETETVYEDYSDRLRLALKIAELDGGVLERLVKKECDKRGWVEPSSN